MIHTELTLTLQDTRVSCVRYLCISHTRQFADTLLQGKARRVRGGGVLGERVKEEGGVVSVRGKGQLTDLSRVFSRLVAK